MRFSLKFMVHGMSKAHWLLATLSVKLGYILKKITGNEDLETPILLLPFYSLLFVSEANKVVDNLTNFGSIILSEPILFGENIFGTLGNLSWFFVAIMILIIAFKQKQLFLKVTYLLGTIPLILTEPVINKIGIKSLYFMKFISILLVIVCLINYLVKTIRLYQIALKNGGKTENQTLTTDG